jgi:hypothetical protein
MPIAALRKPRLLVNSSRQDKEIRAGARGRQGAAMADIVNLNRARKRRARDEAAQRAAENRVRYGRTKEEREAAAREAERAANELEGKRKE